MSAAQPLLIAAGATLDITWDWSAWLADGETISARTVTAVSPLTKGVDSHAAGVITAWVTVPGAALVGTLLMARCQITTTAGRTDTRRFALMVADR